MKPDEIIETIEKNLKVYNIESCLLIYFFLMIYGRTTPHQLRNELHISKATLFRSLGFLLDAGFVTKDELENSDDKRYTHYYTIGKTINEIANFEISDGLKELAKKKNRLKIIEEWEFIMQRAPTIYSNITGKLFELKQKTALGESQIKTIIVKKESNKEPQLLEELKMKRGCRIKFFTVMETSDDDLFIKLQEFLNSLELNQDYLIKKEKMKKPISISIDFIEL